MTTGRTSQNVPYALPPNPLVDWPPVSQEVAELVRLPPTTPGGAIPAGTFNGQEYLLDVTPGGGGRTLWRLRWSATLARWTFIGGQPLFAYAEGPINQPSGAWTAGAGIAALVVPIPGRYRVRFGCEAMPAAPSYASYGVIGPGLAITDYFPPFIFSAAANQNLAIHTERELAFTGSGGWGAVNTAIQASGAAVTFQRFFVSLHPVLLGGV